MKTKMLLAGITLGVLVTGGILWSLGYLNKTESGNEIFANKERCVKYTQNRQAVMNDKADLLGHIITVEGFFSPKANTCMTHSSEIAPGHYRQMTLIDELTGGTEAFAFEATGEDFKALSTELVQEQAKQVQTYYETLKTFRNEN